MRSRRSPHAEQRSNASIPRRKSGPSPQRGQRRRSPRRRMVRTRLIRPSNEEDEAADSSLFSLLHGRVGRLRRAIGVQIVGEFARLRTWILRLPAGALRLRYRFVSVSIVFLVSHVRWKCSFSARRRSISCSRRASCVCSFFFCSLLPPALPPANNRRRRRPPLPFRPEPRAAHAHRSRRAKRMRRINGPPSPVRLALVV